MLSEAGNEDGARKAATEAVGVLSRFVALPAPGWRALTAQARLLALLGHKQEAETLLDRAGEACSDPGGRAAAVSPVEVSAVGLQTVF